MVRAGRTPESLSGGNSTAVTRIDDTVRRTAGPWTPTIHALLRQLRAAGITEVSEPFGLDDEGREILSYRPGEVANHPLPDWLWDPDILDQSATLLRRVHDGSIGFVHPEAVWQLPGHHPAEVICLNDVAPYNMVFVDGRLTGVIDIDTASPGPRIWDLSYLAYRIVPFVEDAGEPFTRQEQVERLDRLIAAYGADWSRDDVLTVMVDRLLELADYTDGRAADTGRDEFVEHAALYRRDAARLSRR